MEDALSSRQFEYFVRVAELRSFRRAADCLRIAQPALSRQIQRLEENLGVALFVRNARGIELTSAGQLMLERAKYILREIEQTRADITARATIPSGQVSFGAPPSIAEVLYPRLSQTYLSRYPDVRLRLFVGVGHLWDWLIDGQIDLAILPKAHNRAGPQYELHTLVKEPVYLAGRADDNTMPGNECGFEDLVHRSLILSPPPSTARTWLDRQVALKGEPLRIVIETESLDVQINMVKAGFGYAVLPYSAVAGHVRAGTLTISRIEGVTLARTLARRTDRPITPAIHRMMEITREEMRKLQGEGIFGPDCEKGQPATLEAT